jgi:hypothetical protein
MYVLNQVQTVRVHTNHQIALQWHYRILQALALDEDVPEKPDDKTIPKYRQIHKVSFHT